MATENRVRIIVMYEGQRYFFVRMDSPNRPLLADFESVGGSALLSRESAVAICRKLREGGWQSTVETKAGVVLFEDVITPPAVQAPAPERVPHHAGEILIVPGADRFWYIRFPASPFESIKGVNPDDCYRKLIEHPRSAEMVPLAERYVAPPEHIVTPTEIKEAIRKERTKNLRPGDRQEKQ